jgi:rhodanese-related sulfurtransferase
VAQLGTEAALVDLRPADEASGALGHVPGSRFLAIDQVPRDRVVVLFDADGRGAARAARRLENEGHPLVAALGGGLAAWRRVGLATVRAPAPQSAAPASRSEDARRGGADAVHAQLSDPRVVRWIQLAAVARMGHLSCVDGRDERGVIGTPGGDAGELLLQLAALEELTGRRLGERDVASLLIARIDALGALYLHTDFHALAHLLEAVRAEPRLRSELADVENVEALVPRLLRPPPGAREALLELMVEPANVGCGHLRLIGRHPEEYGVRAGLAADLLRAALRLLWSGSPEVLLTALSGEHDESAVLDVRLESPLWALEYVPLVPPRIAGEQMFVHHSDVVAFLREASVQLLLRSELPVRVDAARADELRETLTRLAARQLAATLGHLAQGLPVYQATFRADRGVDVRLASG